MSTQATLFSVYVIAGLLLMVVAMATGAKGRRARALDPLMDGTAPGAGMLFFVAVLWPVWLIVLLVKKDASGGDSRRQ